MMTTDPIADMLTRIRNGLSANRAEVIVPYSKIKFSIANILKQQGYIADVKKVENKVFSHIELQFTGSERKITKVDRISKPGRRVYSAKTDIPHVLGGRGIVIVSTPAGIMTGVQARKAGVGGELICSVY